MGVWHETRLANVALRAAGVGLLFVAGTVTAALYHRVHGHAPREANVAELGLAALLVGSALIGNALLVIGPTWWKQVEVPGRRSFNISEAGALASVFPVPDTGMPDPRLAESRVRPISPHLHGRDDGDGAERRFA